MEKTANKFLVHLVHGIDGWTSMQELIKIHSMDLFYFVYRQKFMISQHTMNATTQRSKHLPLI